MKAQVLYKADDVKNHPLKLKDIDILRPKKGEVLIKIKVCGICRTDLHIIEGELKLTNLPLTPGHQIVGTIEECDPEVLDLKVGDRIGIGWVQATCGKCRFCLSDRKNLCEHATFTGWTTQGGYADFMVAKSHFVYPLPEGFSDTEAAPLLCAGIIGYRSLKMMDIADWKGRRIGIYGFGAAGHIAIQLLRAWGAEVYVCTREKTHQELAQELGATWDRRNY